MTTSTLTALLTTLRRQLPKAEMHGFGTLLALGLFAALGYYEHVGDHATAQKILIALLAIIAPAPFRSQNASDAPADEEH